MFRADSAQITDNLKKGGKEMNNKDLNNLINYSKEQSEKIMNVLSGLSKRLDVVEANMYERKKIEHVANETKHSNINIDVVANKILNELKNKGYSDTEISSMINNYKNRNTPKKENQYS